MAGWKICCLRIWQVYGEDEWSFGFCEQGTGVFSCPSGKNPMYTYRECIVLGSTNCSIFKVNQILRELSREWPGSSYDLLAKNCNHFCDEFCERLGVPKLPGMHYQRILLSSRFKNIDVLSMLLKENMTIHKDILNCCCSSFGNCCFTP